MERYASRNSALPPNAGIGLSSRKERETGRHAPRSNSRFESPGREPEAASGRSGVWGVGRNTRWETVGNRFFWEIGAVGTVGKSLGKPVEGPSEGQNSGSLQSRRTAVHRDRQDGTPPHAGTTVTVFPNSYPTAAKSPRATIKTLGRPRLGWSSDSDLFYVLNMMERYSNRPQNKKSGPHTYPVRSSRAFAPAPLTGRDTLCERAVRWILSWTVRNYPGVHRGMVQLLGMHVTYSAIKGWRMGRRPLPGWAADTMATTIRARCRKGLELADELDEWACQRARTEEKQRESKRRQLNAMRDWG